MPSGKVHAALTISIASGVAAPYAIVQFNANPYLYLTGIAVGIMVTPDLDVDNGMYTDTIIRKVSRPLQWIWRMFWYPYAILIPHRSPVSHFPFLGTIIRFGYIALAINLVRLLLGYPLAFWWDWSFFFGICHADIVHFLADKTIKGKEIFER